MDTSVKTATTGYLQRRLVKGMEDNKAEYDGTIRNAEGCIIEFTYGTDGYDPSKLEKMDVPMIDWDDDKLREYVDDGTLRGKYEFERAIRARDMIWAQRRVHSVMVETQALSPVHLSRLLDFTQSSLEKEKESEEDVHLDDGNDSRPACYDIVDELVDKVHHSPTLALLVCVLMCNKQLKRRSFDCNTVSRICGIVEQKEAQAQLAGGEAVGAQAAQSIGEPTTQM